MLETKNRTEAQIYTYEPGIAIKEVIRALGFDPEQISIEDLQGIADRLSVLAKKDPPWGWRYLRNVMNKKMEASGKLIDAVMRLGATIDGTPDELVKSERVSIQAVGHVRPGALVLADSRPCANPGCRVEFVPRVPWQKCHNAECARIARKVKSDGVKRNERGKK